MAGEQEANSDTFADGGYATSDQAVKAGLFDNLADEDDDVIPGDSEGGEPEEDAPQDDDASEEDASEDGGEEADDSDSDDGEETEVATLEDLAAASKLDAKDLDGLELTVSIDGEEQSMSVGALREMAKTNRQEQWTGAFQELAGMRRETASVATQLANDQKQAAEINGKLLAEIENTLLGDQSELQRLAAENSPLYGRKREQFEAKVTRLNELKSVVGLQQEDADGRGGDAEQAKRNNEAELLYLHHPEFRTDTTAASEAMGRVGQLMHKLGYSEDEIRATVDHRLIRLALMASSGEGQKEKALKTIKTKLKKPAGKRSMSTRGTAGKSKADAARSARALDRLAKDGSEAAFAESLKIDGLA